MHKRYIWKPWIRHAVHSVGGAYLPGEHQKDYLARVSLCLGIGFSTLRAAYHGQDTPDGYIGDPPDAKCPHCGKKNKSCSYVNSLSRAWARGACAKKNSKSS